MQNENRQNQQNQQAPNSEQSGGAKPVEQRTAQNPSQTQGPNPPEDYLRMRDWIRQAQSDSEQAQIRAKQAREETEDLKLELQNQGRKTKGTGWTAALLAIVLIGACGYGYYALDQQGISLQELPGLKDSLQSVGQRIDSAEAKLQEWSSNWEGIGARIAKVENSLRSNLQVAKNYALEQSAKVHHEVQAELDNRTKWTQTELSRLQSSQQEDHSRLAEVQEEIAAVRRENSQQVAQVQQETRRQTENLSGQISRNQRDLDTLNHELDRRRLAFEVSKDQAREVAPGIMLTISNTNVSYQRVEGRIHVVPDGRILWIRGQGIQQPVNFYSHEDNRPYEVVFTRVSKDSVVGYVQMPLWPNAGMPVAANVAPESPEVFVQ